MRPPRAKIAPADGHPSEGQAQGFDLRRRCMERRVRADTNDIEMNGKGSLSISRRAHDMLLIEGEYGVEQYHGFGGTGLVAQDAIEPAV